MILHLHFSHLEHSQHHDLLLQILDELRNDGTHCWQHYSRIHEKTKGHNLVVDLESLKKTETSLVFYQTLGVVPYLGQSVTVLLHSG